MGAEWPWVYDVDDGGDHLVGIYIAFVAAVRPPHPASSVRPGVRT